MVDHDDHTPTPRHPAKLYLVATDAARLAGVTRQTVAVHSRDGRLRAAAKTSNGIRLYELPEVLRWARSRGQAA